MNDPSIWPMCLVIIKFSLIAAAFLATAIMAIRSKPPSKDKLAQDVLDFPGKR